MHSKAPFGSGKTAFLSTVLATFLISGSPVRAESDWFSVTFDNDLFVASDNGYTNGVYLSWFDTPEGEHQAEPGLLASIMLWSLPEGGGSKRTLSINTLGQTMMTPDDITEDPPTPPPADLPYAGLLLYRDTFVQINRNVADAVAVTVGVVGEYSFTEETQTFIHDITGSDDPCCWDEQLADEVVFEFSRSRVWRTWVSDSENADILVGAGLSLRTISSTAGANVMFRYGRGLKYSYASAVLAYLRTINPVATRSGWYLFGGVGASYLGNHILLDGSRSYGKDFDELDYDNERVSVSTGIAYSWQEASLTFALNDDNIIEDSGNETSSEFTRYGSITLAWKLD